MVMMKAVPAALVETGFSKPAPGVRRAPGAGARRAGRERRIEHTPEWRAPAPLWDRALADPDPAALYRPVVLRFDRDEFMDDLLALLERSPEELPGYVAQPETWRDERAGWLPSNDARWSAMPFKLYQPVHGRHYLVTADLVCRIPGLPCRTVDRAKDESVSFVLRRLAPRRPDGAVNPADPSSYVEEAWGGPERGWAPLADPGKLASFDGEPEERHPLFSVFFKLAGRKRRLLAGLVPVSSRQSYEAKGARSPFAVPVDPEDSDDPRRLEFRSKVERALSDLLGPGPSAEERAEISTFLLYDFAELLHDRMRPVWEIVEEKAGLPETGPLPGNVGELAGWLLTTPIDAPESGEGTTWADSMVDLWRNREALLAGGAGAPSYTITNLSDELLEDLRARVEAAVDELKSSQPPPDPQQGPAVPTLPKMEAEAGAYYVIRCVYERPRCGDLRPPLVSEPSRPFQIASFFDPDAPTRPVRITLPADTSIAGLRKFKRDVSFFASKQLRSQLERLRGAGFSDLEDGLPERRNFELGMVCTLSIPIITLCATILLMIILQLLHIVFWWLPFVKVCFPTRR